MNKRIYIILILMLSACFMHAACPLRIDGAEAASVGILIKDIEKDSVLLEYNSRQALTPASIMKAVTTATALRCLHPDSAFTTTASLRGHAAPGGIWDGDLIIKACADPTLGSSHMDATDGLIRNISLSLQRRGIKSISGKITVQSPHGGFGAVPQWEVEDIESAYGAPLYGFNYRDNYEAHKSNSRYEIQLTDPEKLFIHELKNRLEADSITVADSISDFSGYTTDIQLATHRSPCYGSIMHNLMVHSNNLFAEGMLRATLPGHSRTQCIAHLKELWNNSGISTAHTTLMDGSGLARTSRFSAAFLSDILGYMARSSMAAQYTALFPRTGQEGTVRTFLDDKDVHATFAIKTGSMTGVQSYAGYLLDNSGKPTHSIVIIVNGFFCPRTQVKSAAEELIYSTLHLK